MLAHITTLKNILIKEFQHLYSQYQADDIYACCLVFNDYLWVDHLAVSTTKSIFSDHEERQQYLPHHERWNVSKWRYRSESNQNLGIQQLKFLSSANVERENNVSNLLFQYADQSLMTHIELLHEALHHAKAELVQHYGNAIHEIVFFISQAAQPELELSSARFLNQDSERLRTFLVIKQAQLKPVQQHRSKLSQADKDLLIDLAQIVEINPYDYLYVAHEAYLLTLEPSFIDINIYIQKLVHSIAAMAYDSAGRCAMSKTEILQRIEQFYYTARPNALDA